MRLRTFLVATFAVTGCQFFSIFGEKKVETPPPGSGGGGGGGTSLSCSGTNASSNKFVQLAANTPQSSPDVIAQEIPLPTPSANTTTISTGQSIIGSMRVSDNKGFRIQSSHVHHMVFYRYDVLMPSTDEAFHFVSIEGEISVRPKVRTGDYTSYYGGSETLYAEWLGLDKPKFIHGGISPFGASVNIYFDGKTKSNAAGIGAKFPFQDVVTAYRRYCEIEGYEYREEGYDCVYAGSNQVPKEKDIAPFLLYSNNLFFNNIFEGTSSVGGYRSQNGPSPRPSVYPSGSASPTPPPEIITIWYTFPSVPKNKRTQLELRTDYQGDYGGYYTEPGCCTTYPLTVQVTLTSLKVRGAESKQITELIQSPIQGGCLKVDVSVPKEYDNPQLLTDNWDGVFRPTPTPTATTSL